MPLRFTANYAYTNSNFVIENLSEDTVRDYTHCSFFSIVERTPQKEMLKFIVGSRRQINNLDGTYYSAFCVIKNILQRGNPTLMSDFLQSRIARLQDFDEFQQSRYVDLLQSENSQSFKEYEYYSLLATATIRFQILVLELLQRGVLKFTDSNWVFYVFSHELRKDFATLAVEDLFLWFENLFQLMKVPFEKPQVTVRYCNENSLLSSEDGLKIDLSLSCKVPSELVDEVIYLRSEDSSNDYFKVETARNIEYDIDPDNEEDVRALRFFLKNIFGFEDFTDGQIPVIARILSGKDTVALLPTGRGKSLCYQLSALLQPAVSLVVSPLKSLMFDQEYNLKKQFYISRVNKIHSGQSPTDKQKVMREYSSGKYLFIIVTPERVQRQDFRNCLSELSKDFSVSYAIIDEVHCLSEWGHDFRTSYANLVPTLRKLWPNVKFLGLTATALPYVLIDLMNELGIDTSGLITPKSFTRPELNFYVHKVHDNLSKEVELFKILYKLNQEKNAFKISGEDTYCGVIFTPFKRNSDKSDNKYNEKECEPLAQDLSRSFNVTVKSYSGNDKDEIKIKVQTEFKENKFPLLVCTSRSFGIGIDKSNIRYTVHFGLPMSLETLYQEVGRAGRDKYPADCYIIYTKEQLSWEKLSNLFSPKMRPEKIEEALSELKEENISEGDLITRLRLQIKDNKGVDEDVKLLQTIFESYATPNQMVVIELFGKKLGDDTRTEIEKGLHRMKLIGLIQDWTVDFSRNSFSIQFSDYNEENVWDGMIRYIKRYDKEFILERKKPFIDKYRKYIDIYSDETMTTYEKVFRILVEWIYDNLVYSRRQSLKNVFELCRSYKDSTSFREELERYFVFSGVSRRLERVADEPLNYTLWFDVFYIDMNYNILIEKEELKNIQGILRRLLESYRFNTGIDFITGMTQLMLGDLEEMNAKERLESAIRTVSSWNEQEAEIVLSEIFNLKPLISLKYRYELGRILSKNFRSIKHLERIYLELKDPYSLKEILKHSIKKLKKIGGAVGV